MILVLNKMSTEGQGNAIVKITRKDNKIRKERLCSSLVQKLKSPAAECPTSENSGSRISDVKKVL
jgi:hypothetical protein